MVTVLRRGPGYVVVVKPPGMLVHRSGFAGPDRDVLLQRVRKRVGRHVSPIHRLDRQASGIVVFSVDEPGVSAGELQRTLEAGDKRYLALVRGVVRVEHTLINRAMRDERGVEQEASSELWCRRRCAEPRCSLVEVRPFTGRYHQVRRHVRDLGHPVLGDNEHGDYRVNREWAALGLRRLALHAWHLDVEIGGERLRIECPLYPDLRDLVATLRWQEPPDEVMLPSTAPLIPPRAPEDA